MARTSSRWRFMNPLQWLKTIYETVGTPHPRASLTIVAILGAVAFGGIWWFTGKQVEKDRQAIISPKASGNASTVGANSPAVTGTGNEIQYQQSSEPQEKPKAPEEKSKPPK